MLINKSFLVLVFVFIEIVFVEFSFRLYYIKISIMLGGPGGDDPDTTRRMADLQVRSSFIQFVVAVGLINLGKTDFRKIEMCGFFVLAPYVLQAVMGENVR
jgi:hypothetical protein